MPHDGRRWCTNPQYSHLKNKIPEYRDAQQLNQYHVFWPALYREWFSIWPEREPTDADLSDQPEALSDSDVPMESAEEEVYLRTDIGKRKTKAATDKAKRLAKQVRLLLHLKYCY